MIIFLIAHRHTHPAAKVTDWHCIRLDPTAAGFRQLRDQTGSVGIYQDVPGVFTFSFQHPLAGKVLPFLFLVIEDLGVVGLSNNLD